MVDAVSRLTSTGSPLSFVALQLFNEWSKLGSLLALYFVGIVMDQNPMPEEVTVALPGAVGSAPLSKASVAASIHLLGLSIATLIATVEIHSILISGWICSCSGIIAGVFAAWARRWRSFVTLMMTPILAICLVIVEFFLSLGPDRAGIPFSIVFLMHQTISSILLISDLRRNGVEAADELSGRFTIRTLLVIMVIVAVFFSIWRLAIQTDNAACIGMALLLVGLNSVGIALAFIRHRASKDHMICERETRATQVPNAD